MESTPPFAPPTRGRTILMVDHAAAVGAANTVLHAARPRSWRLSMEMILAYLVIDLLWWLRR